MIDYLFFILGLAFFFLGFFAYRFKFFYINVKWDHFIIFAILLGISDWINLFLLSNIQASVLFYIAFGTSSVACLSLLEFSIQSFRKKSQFRMYSFFALMTILMILVFFNLDYAILLQRFLFIIPSFLMASWYFFTCKFSSSDANSGINKRISLLLIVLGVLLAIIPQKDPISLFHYLSPQFSFPKLYKFVLFTRLLIMSLLSHSFWKLDLLNRLNTIRINVPVSWISRSKSFGISIILTLICGWGFTEWMGKYIETEEKNKLLVSTRIASNAIDIQKIKKLEGNETDLSKDEYNRIKFQLGLMRLSHPSCRFMYLSGFVNDRLIIFVDSEPADSIDCSPPGDLFYDAGDEFVEAVREGYETVVPPYIDRWGEWISSVVPIVDPFDKKHLCSMSMDISSSYWYSMLYIQRLLPITISLIIVILLVGFYFTDQKSIESNQKLLLSEERLNLALHGAELGLWDWDIQYENLFFDNRARAVLGFSNQDIPMTMKEYHQFIHPKDLENKVEALNRHLQGETDLYEAEYRLFPNTDQPTWIMDRGKVITRDETGKPIRAAGTFLNITSKKISEELLRESETRFGLVVTKTGEVIYECDSLSNSMRLYGAIERVTGYPEDEIQGFSYDKWFDLVHTEDRKSVIESIETAKKESSNYDMEYRFLHKSGDYIYLADHGVFLADEFRSSGRRIGILIDINKQKVIHKKSLEIERNLQHAQKLESLGIMAGGIAHDFNNLLMAILGNLDLALLEMSQPGKVREYIEHALTASFRAAEMTNQLLAYSGKSKLLFQPVNLNQIVNEILDLTRRSVLRKPNILISLDQELPLVMADSSQLEQVLMNLCVNAAEAIETHEGVIEIETGVRYFTEQELASNRTDIIKSPGKYCYFSIKDNGCGMNEETQLRLFEPFFTTKFTGRGLGMSAVLGIMKSHSGAIIINSKPNIGTGILLLFDIAETEVALTSKQLEPSVKSTTNNFKLYLHGAVLVVDDEDNVRATCKMMLEFLGLEVLTASDCDSALELFQTHRDRISCVIVDLTMPRLNGFQLYQLLKREKSDIKVILMSGYSIDAAKIRKDTEGIAGFLEKPFEVNQLHRLLTSIFK